MLQLFISGYNTIFLFVFASFIYGVVRSRCPSIAAVSLCACCSPQKSALCHTLPKQLLDLHMPSRLYHAQLICGRSTLTDTMHLI